MDSKKAREIMREHQSGFVKLNPRWCAIEKLIEDSEKLEKIENIITETENQHYELQGKKVVMSSLAYGKIKEVIENE